MALSMLFIGCTQTDFPNEPIGGDADEHGCIGSAGYTWCETLQRCTRSWEEPCETLEGFTDDDKAERIVVNWLNYRFDEIKNLDYVTFESTNCEGCYNIEVDVVGVEAKGSETLSTSFNIELKNWKISEAIEKESVRILTVTECKAEGGRQATVCLGDETYLGNTKDSTMICCFNDYTCTTNEDCVPLPGCHPSECINRLFESEYALDQPLACTMEFRQEAAYTPEDCICQDSRCTNMNLITN